MSGVGRVASLAEETGRIDGHEANPSRRPNKPIKRCAFYDLARHQRGLFDNWSDCVQSVANLREVSWVWHVVDYGRGVGTC